MKGIDQVSLQSYLHKLTYLELEIARLEAQLTEVAESGTPPEYARLLLHRSYSKIYVRAT